MKKKILWKSLGVAVLSALIVFVSGVAIMYESNRRIVREQLADETQLVALLLQDAEHYEGLDAYETDTAFRITVIAEDGEVLFESDTDAPLENHLDREEVRGALDDAPRTVERYSKTFRCQMTYCAQKTTLSDGRVAVVRLAVRSSEITAYLTAALPFLVLALGVALLIALLFADRMSKHISGKITAVSDSLRSLNTGAYRPLATDSREPEFYLVFHEINELNQSIHRHIRTEETEHEKLDAVMSGISQGIIALNASGSIVLLNRSATELFGGSPEDVGKNLIYLIEDSTLCHEILAHAGEDHAFEYEHAGRTVSVDIRRITDRALAETLSCIVIVTDITGEKEIIRQKSEFFANASHELKTPITVIQGLTEVLLTKEHPDETTHHQIERIHKEAVRLSSLISDMLRLSMLERNTVEELRIAVDLKETAREVISELSGGIADKQITVHLDGEGTVTADPRQMFELIQNLCSNAVNYNKEGGTLDIRITEDAEGVTLQVADSGIGIAREHIPHLCERFYRVDKSRSKKTGGTGLGLAIVKHICTLYGATLTIDSELDRGTTVTVTFHTKDDH